MSSVKLKFGEFCRLCLKQTDELVFINSPDEDCVTYFNKLIFINNELASENDVYPEWICIKCKKQLNFTYKFHKKCLKSKSILIECLNQIKTQHFGETGKQFFITNIKMNNTISIKEDPLNFEDRDLENMENDINNMEDMPLSVKTEIEDDITIDEQKFGIDKLEFVSGFKTEGEENYFLDTIKTEPDVETDNFELVVPAISKMIKNQIESTKTADKNVETIYNYPIEENYEFLTDNTSETSKIKVQKLKKRKLSKTKKNLELESDQKWLPMSDNPMLASDEWSLSCDICLKLCENEDELEIHKKIHESLFACALCGKNFKYKTELKKHIDNHMDKKDGYRRHKRTRSGIKEEIVDNFECSICSDKFETQMSLLKHTRCHFRDKK